VQARKEIIAMATYGVWVPRRRVAMENPINKWPIVSEGERDGTVWYVSKYKDWSGAMGMCFLNKERKWPN